VTLKTSDTCNPNIVPSQDDLSSDAISQDLLNDNRDPVALHHAKNVIANISNLVRTKVSQSKTEVAMIKEKEEHVIL